MTQHDVLDHDDKLSAASLQGVGMLKKQDCPGGGANKRRFGACVAEHSEDLALPICSR